ncbi:hypothetical protein SAMD00019534_046950 [Acytostelium subglobosum LB1]|uniref:hypothetical protein n=1 Tax=Acytostelium subglobosum LB1 TaxID=1410327 RepID=UPI000644B599|nr:hypothetical protein SAMD00019534_046950 [Acytostelium subglobosum LB1]GAM21520.1 hypothetical protein SAMD00019534_046950 [Acytostelium subglobosum LB1]|eukprot:XP_012755639.1 hypothetical protein SAMD00019534_046950 [Acytostelium subglobosum LB1]
MRKVEDSSAPSTSTPVVDDDNSNGSVNVNVNVNVKVNVDVTCDVNGIDTSKADDNVCDEEDDKKTKAKKNKKQQQQQHQKNNIKLQLLLCPHDRYPNLLNYFNEASTQNIDDKSTSSYGDESIKRTTQIHDMVYRECTPFQSDLISLLNRNKLTVTTADVPRYPPLTHAIWTEWNKIWPLVFKSHFFSTPLVPTLEDIELSRMVTFMKRAIKQANIAKSLGFNPVGCVIVDPETDEVHVATHDMSPSSSSSGKMAATCNHLLSPILSHCTMNAIHKLAEQHQSVHATKLKMAGIDLSTSNGVQTHPNSEEDAYLATDLCLYITREPCIMCSMALVHSRIKRVVFGTPQPQAGGLGGTLKVHTQKSINHRFQVYRGILQEQCQALLDVDDNNNNSNSSGDGSSSSISSISSVSSCSTIDKVLMT